jgi:hypothetical protein
VLLSGRAPNILFGRLLTKLYRLQFTKKNYALCGDLEKHTAALKCAYTMEEVERAASSPAWTSLHWEAPTVAHDPSSSVSHILSCILYAVALENAGGVDHAATYAAHAASSAASAVKNFDWDICVGILEGALAIGKQSDPIDEALIVARMDKIKRQVAAL